MIVVPATFSAYRIADSGEAGRRWIEELPALIETLCTEWSLEVENSEPLHGYLGIIVPVRRGQEPCMLKVSWLEDGTAIEAHALEAWNGHGAVRLYAARPEVGALLMERLDSRRSLHDLKLFDAAEIAGRLLRQLAVPAPDDLRTLHDSADSIAEFLLGRQQSLNYPVPSRWVEMACKLARDLGSRADDKLVHGDLHYGNVLAGRREPWLAVDPKPVAGDPEYAVPELLWTRVDEVDGAAGLQHLLEVLVESGELDAEVARGWSIVRCVDYWLWGLAHGLTKDPVRCQRILEALV